MKELQQAAEQYAQEAYPWQDGYESWKLPIQDFKAGAEWMKEQLIVWLKSEADYLMQELKNGNKAYGLAEQYRAQLYKEIVNKLKED